MQTNEIKRLRKYLDKIQVAHYVTGMQVAILCTTEDQTRMLDLLKSIGFEFQHKDTYNYPNYIVVV